MTTYAPHPGYSDGTWSVVKVHDDGRHEVLHTGLRPEAAQAIAGAMRDELEEAEVAQGWNVVEMSAGQLKVQSGVAVGRWVGP